MKTKEITEALGIPRERIKYYKEKNVFMPEGMIVGNKTDYTQTDFENLQRLVILTKSGLSCTEIKEVQSGSKSLQEVVVEKRAEILETLERMKGSLSLMDELMERNEQYETMHTEEYWSFIKQKEMSGDEFMDIDDGYYPTSLIRRIKCPCCDKEFDVDLEEFLWDQSGYDHEYGMGPDIVYSFDSEDNFECPECSRVIRIKGWIREYPIGAYDSEDIDAFEEGALLDMTNEERLLLKRMASGELDGFVGNDSYTSGGSTIWMAIKNGIPARFKQGPGKRFFNGKENERIEGALHILQEWKTDEQKIQFLRKFGWLMNDVAARAYSAKFKPTK